MDPLLASVGAQIRDLRKQRRLTQAELAHQVGINPNLLGRIERGSQNLTLLTLARVAAGLDVSLGELVRECPPAALPSVR